MLEYEGNSFILEFSQDEKNVNLCICLNSFGNQNDHF